jgi:hypothetical protein
VTYLEKRFSAMMMAVAKRLANLILDGDAAVDVNRL